MNNKELNKSVIDTLYKIFKKVLKIDDKIGKKEYDNKLIIEDAYHEAFVELLYRDGSKLKNYFSYSLVELIF